MDYTRREFGKLAMTAMPVSGLLTPLAAVAQTAKPHSNFGGVQIGIISGSFRRLAPSVEDILKWTVQVGLNVIELDSDFFEPYLGAPAPTAVGGSAAAQVPASRPTTQASGSGPTDTQTPAAAPRDRRSPTPEEEKARLAARDELRRWRLSPPLEKMRTLRKMYEQAGVAIQLVKFPDMGDASMTDAEVDYCFAVAKNLGASGITCEPPLSQTKRVGRFADKHKMIVSFHGHANITSVEAFGRTGSWEQAFFYSPYNWANVDIGHFTAGNGKPPTDFIREYHDRITNIHLKDRKINGPNMPWGQGDTPIKETLQLMKRERYKFTATIELEYPIPAGSTVVDEVGKCVQYCKDALA